MKAFQHIFLSYTNVLDFIYRFQYITCVCNIYYSRLTNKYKHTIFRQHYIATRISRSAIFWSVNPCFSLRVSRKVQRVGLVHCTKDLNPWCQPSAMLDDIGKPASQCHADSNILDRTWLNC